MVQLFRIGENLVPEFLHEFENHVEAGEWVYHNLDEEKYSAILIENGSLFFYTSLPCGFSWEKSTEIGRVAKPSQILTRFRLFVAA
jgi:hypothetical protein